MNFASPTISVAPFVGATASIASILEIHFSEMDFAEFHSSNCCSSLYWRLAPENDTLVFQRRDPHLTYLSGVLRFEIPLCAIISPSSPAVTFQGRSSWF